MRIRRQWGKTCLLPVSLYHSKFDFSVTVYFLQGKALQDCRYELWPCPTNHYPHGCPISLGNGLMTLFWNNLALSVLVGYNNGLSKPPVYEQGGHTAKIDQSCIDVTSS